MSSVLRSVRKRKKARRVGRVEVLRREDYGELELAAKVELIRSLVPLGLMHVAERLDAEVTALAGVLAPVAVDRSPSPPRSWAKTAGSPQVHVSDARDRRDGLRQARV